MSFAERFDRDGCLLVERLFDPELIDRVAAEFDRQFGQAGEEAWRDVALKVGDRRFELPIRLQGPLLDPGIHSHPILLQILSGLLGDQLLIDSVSCVAALPGAADQPAHRDYEALFANPELDARLDPFAVTVAIPLIDLDETTGTTRLKLGSHRRNRDVRVETPYPRRGDCYLMDYRLSHYGTSNRSGQCRPILYIIYARPWFIDAMNFQIQPRIAMAAEDLWRLPVGQRRLFRRLAAPGGVDCTERELLARG